MVAQEEEVERLGKRSALLIKMTESLAIESCFSITSWWGLTRKTGVSWGDFYCSRSWTSKTNTIPWDLDASS